MYVMEFISIFSTNRALSLNNKSNCLPFC